MTLSKKLQKLRRKNGYSQEELAEKLGVSRQAVSKWERGDSFPDTNNLIAVAALYNVSVDELAGCIRGDPSIAYTPDAPVSEGISLNKNDYKKTSCAESAGILPEEKFVKMAYPEKESEEIYPPREIFPDKPAEEIYPGRNTSEVITENIKNAEETAADEIPQPAPANFADSAAPAPMPIPVPAPAARQSAYDFSYNSPAPNASQPGKALMKKAAEFLSDPLKANVYRKLMHFPFWAIALFAFFFFGGIHGWWEYSWIFFLTIPIYYTGVRAIFSKNWYVFCYPALVVMGWFGATWFLGLNFHGRLFDAFTIACYLSIPLYYTAILAYRKRNVKFFCFPVLAVMAFLVFGTLFSAYEECLWMLALIPFCYYFSPKLNQKLFGSGT